MMDILKRIDFVQQFANEYADGSWSIDTEKWKHHVTPEFIEDIRQYIVSLQLKLMHEQTAQEKPYTFLWEADGTCEAVKGHVCTSSNTGPAHGWKVTPIYLHPPQPQATTAVPEGYVLVSKEALIGMKGRVNTLATLSLKAERYSVGISIKQTIADILATAQGKKP